MTDRVRILSVNDRQQFMTANILAILNQCHIQNDQLLQDIELARKSIKKYQADHQTYHWPIKHGKSVAVNSPFWGRFMQSGLSPDADCTCMQQIVLNESMWIDDIVSDLSFYRIDRTHFQLPKFQQDLPDSDGTFTTWFPERENCCFPKIETIDIVTDVNILWFLSLNNRISTPGAGETVRLIKRVLATDLILTDPFKLTIYYPYPAVILYCLSRAIQWGQIEALYEQKDTILNLARRVEASSHFDHLMLASIGKYWSDGALFRGHWKIIRDFQLNPGTFFSGSLLAPVVQRWSWAKSMAQHPFFQFQFQSEALQWAMLLWLYV